VLSLLIFLLDSVYVEELSLLGKPRWIFPSDENQVKVRSIEKKAIRIAGRPQSARTTNTKP